MRLLILLGVFIAAAACVGITEDEVDNLIQDAVGTAIAEIPVPSIDPNYAIDFSVGNNRTTEMTLNDLLGLIRQSNGRISTLSNSIDGTPFEDGVIERLGRLEDCAGQLGGALGKLADDVNSAVVLGSIVFSPRVFGCSDY